jgi:hypothetical protein
MATAKQLDDHAWMLKQLKASQESDTDMREQVREAHTFVDARDGQWEPQWWSDSEGKPRYTFDMCNPIIDQVTSQIERTDFDIKVTPTGGDSTKENAATYDGIIRNIETISNANSIYNRAGRETVVGGLSGWRVAQAYVDGNSFDQDLTIQRIGGYVDRVWHGPHEEPSASDAKMCWILTGIPDEDFKEKYPKRSESAGLDNSRNGNTYYHRTDLTMVGEFLYIKEVSRELVLMDNGTVYENNEDFAKVTDELAMLGVQEVSRRNRKVGKVYSRLFDNDGFIDKEKETVFENWIPVIPCYGNFKVFEEKLIYWGIVEKMYDAQRVMNYSLSREIEEGALAPRAKYWLTRMQGEGEEDTLATLNTNNHPVQFYNADPEVPGQPQQSGGAQINPGLRTISEAMKGIINSSAGMFAANMGDNINAQSGVALSKLIDQGDNGNNKYVTALEEAQAHTGRILVNAIPRVYTKGRQVRLLKEGGMFEMATIGEQVQDRQTGEMITLHDLGVGTYDVSCTSSPSFKNRQSETVDALTKVGAVDPSVIELGGDILLGNIPSPGMSEIAERKRAQLFNAGMIPDDQLTDEEKAKREQMQNQPPQEDAMMVAARAEEQKAQADMAAAQNKAQQIQQEGAIKARELEISSFNAETNRLEAETRAFTARAAARDKNASATGKEMDNIDKMIGGPE